MKGFILSHARSRESYNRYSRHGNWHAMIKKKATICGSNIKDGKHGEWKKHLKESLNDQKRLFQVYSYRIWESKNLTENMQEEFYLG